MGCEALDKELYKWYTAFVENLLAQVSPDIRARVEAGELELLVGQRPDKPVIREVATGRLITGSGRYPRAIDAAQLGRDTAYKHSKSYREGLEKLVPLEGTGVGSFTWLLEQAIDEAKGFDYHIECQACGADVQVVKRRNAMYLFKFIELLAGKARETQDLNIKSESLIAVLNQRENIRDITVHTIDPATANERRQLIEQND